MSRNETEDVVSVVSFISSFLWYVNGLQLAKFWIVNRKKIIDIPVNKR